MKAVLAVLAFLAVPAAAQTNTRCTTSFGVTNCQTMQQPGVGIDWGLARPAPNAGDSFTQGYQQGQALRAQREAAEAARAQSQASERTRIAENNRLYFRTEAGKMVAGGNCSGARDYAAANGEFELAQQIAAYCASDRR